MLNSVLAIAEERLIVQELKWITHWCDTMEILGLEPDLKNRKLRVLPMNLSKLTSAFLRQPSHRLFLAPATIYQQGLLTDKDSGSLWDEGRLET